MFRFDRSYRVPRASTIVSTYLLLKNKKVLVTGGAGFIGSHIVDELARASLEERIRVSLEETQTRNCCQEIFDDLRLVDEKINILADPTTAIVEKETYKEPGKRNSHNTQHKRNQL